LSATVVAQTQTKPEATSKPVPEAFHAEELYRAGLATLQEGRAEDAVRRFKEAAALKDADAMEQLAEIYTNGAEGVSKDDREAFKWFLSAAEGGNIAAMRSLGGLYLLGSDAVPESDEDAAIWFQKAADKKDPAAMYDLARLYEDGQGVPRNMEKAKELYRQAADLGHAEAQRRLTELQARK
jgi:hypothetical protein